MTAVLGHTDVLRFVALGDSVTVGLGDPAPDGGWRGWAALLSESLAPPGHVELINLARCGARVRDVVADQLPYALAGHPTLASVVVGVNDTLRGRFELATIASDLDEAIAQLREAGALVLTASLPDPGIMLRIPGLLRHPLARRIQAINTVLDHLAARHGTVHLDLTRHPALYDRHMWGVDRIHPSERGHRLLAQLFAVMLADHGVHLWDRLDPRPSHPAPSTWAQVHWLATKGTGWVLRRSLDLLPHLVRMGISEWWHRVRKRTARLDARLRSEIDNVLAALTPEPAAGSGVLEDS
ncbi:SGNH/GDSL hydrolase family protein [Actinoallomurus sp. NPDC050550]|uniref:SGNH/GDSL hydrolase family protein n=1 Tax=Actinoallomurus sp. NPDC050550 TaxID=3154937 RepID=UPI0033C0280E